MRVEYLLALQGVEPPTERCRPVLFALSSGDRRRQREVDAARHLLECEVCAAAQPTAAAARQEQTTMTSGSASTVTRTSSRRASRLASWLRS